MARLVSQVEINDLISGDVVKYLGGAGVYDKIELECAKVVRDVTQITLPADPASRPADMDWVIAPCAWIIQWMVTPRMTLIKDENRRLHKANYDEALRMLARHIITPSPTTTGEPHIGRLEGLYDEY